jgi:DHA2 family multidrug resistance protein
MRVNHRPVLFTAVMAAMVMQVLDTTIANVALPHMEASLSATQETISWVLTSYVLASAVALPLGGWLVDRIGIRLVFTLSVAAFTIASILCGFAQNLGQMVAFRVVQGVGGAFLAPFAQTVMLNASTADERAKNSKSSTESIRSRRTSASSSTVASGGSRLSSIANGRPVRLPGV